MITKVVHGWQPGGLIRYLLGPGRAQEHTNPRVIAAWDGRDTAWQPAHADGRLVLGPLITALEAPAIAAGLPTTTSDSGRRGYVWHCSARVAASDRALTDGEWAQIARELLHRAGIAETGDVGGPRWVAVRHADDHIHLAVVLVRQDDFRRIWPRHDYGRLRTAAREIERRYGLTVTAPADGTAARAPSRGEMEKANRQGVLPARTELRRAVRRAAIAAHDVESLVAVLKAQGYQVKVRRGPSGDVLGYAVARRGDQTSAGEPVFYSGSRLAPDLSLPALRRRWQDGPTPVRWGSPWVGATRSVQRARAQLRRSAVDGAGEDPAGIAYSAGDVAAAVAGLSGAPAWWAEAADLVARAGRVADRTLVEHGPCSLDLRRAARGLLAGRRVVGDEDTSGMLALTVALAALLVELGRWQRRRNRPHQAAAAHTAAAQLAFHAQEPRVDGLDRQLALDLALAAQGTVRSHMTKSRTRAGPTASTRPDRGRRDEPARAY